MKFTMIFSLSLYMANLAYSMNKHQVNLVNSNKKMEEALTRIEGNREKTFSWLNEVEKEIHEEQRLMNQNVEKVQEEELRNILTEVVREDYLIKLETLKKMKTSYENRPKYYEVVINSINEINNLRAKDLAGASSKSSIKRLNDSYDEDIQFLCQNDDDDRTLRLSYKNRCDKRYYFNNELKNRCLSDQYDEYDMYNRCNSFINELTKDIGVRKSSLKKSVSLDLEKLGVLSAKDRNCSQINRKFNLKLNVDTLKDPKVIDALEHMYMGRNGNKLVVQCWESRLFTRRTKLFVYNAKKHKLKLRVRKHIRGAVLDAPSIFNFIKFYRQNILKEN